MSSTTNPSPLTPTHEGKWRRKKNYGAAPTYARQGHIQAICGFNDKHKVVYFKTDVFKEFTDVLKGFNISLNSIMTDMAFSPPYGAG